MELPESMASLQLQDSDRKHQSTEDNSEDTAAVIFAPDSPVINPVEAPVFGAGAVDLTVFETVTPRSLRKRLGANQLPKSLKKPKLSLKRHENLSTDKEIIDYYMKVNKNSNVKQSNLETIFEEPVESKDGNVVMMSGSKLRRSIVFSGRITKTKKMKRSAKMKKFQLTKGDKKKKLTIEEVKMRLAESLDSWEELFECSD